MRIAPEKSHLVLELNLERKKPFANRSIYTKPNVSIIEIGHKGDAENVKFIQKIAHNDERYVRIDELFEPPIEYDRIKQLLEKAKIVFIIGDPGIGKTYTAVRLLKDYFHKGFTPVWYAGLENFERVIQRQILENFKPEHRQIVYFENTFGRTIFERRDSLQQIFGPLIDFLQEVDARVIITSRREIFDQFTKEVVSAFDLRQFMEEMNVVKPSYSIPALIDILHKLSQGRKWYSIAGYKQIVIEEIKKGNLRTPLAIRDFAYSTEKVDDFGELITRFGRRRSEEKQRFAEGFAKQKIFHSKIIADILNC